MRTISCCALFACVIAFAASVEAAILNPLSPSITHDFESFTGGGFAPSPAAGQLDSDDVIVTGMSEGSLTFGATSATTGDFARGVDVGGGVSAGGTYAFRLPAATPTNTLLGVQSAASDFNPGTIVFKFTNGGTTDITSIDVRTLLYVNNDQGRSSSFNLYYSVDATVDTSDTLIDGYTSPEALDALGFVLAAGELSGGLTGLSIAPGTDFYVGYRSADVGGAGSRDEFGLDLVSVTATFAPVPEPSAVLIALLATSAFGAAAMRKRLG